MAVVTDSVPTPPAPTAGGGTAFWLRTVAGWHLVFWVVLAAAAASSLLLDASAVRRATYLGLLGLLGFAYAFLGQPAMRSRDRRQSHVYRIVLVVVLGLVAAYFPTMLLLLYVAYPQIWFLSERALEGIIFTVLLTASVTFGFVAASGWTLAALEDAAPQMVISLGVSLVLGLWITKVVQQSEDRAELIAELEAARDELAAAHHASGVVAERERMAREIHDTLAQGFTSIVMLAETASAQIAQDRPDLAAGGLELVAHTARDNLAEARALVAAFSPVALHEGSLPDAVRRLAARFTSETGVLVGVRFEPDETSVDALHAGQQVVLLRAAQEALTNVRKHAAARRVSVVISATDGEDATIEVGDDGAGFEPSVVPQTGFGLTGMRGRVEAAGGTVLVSSAPGNGTRVEVRVPATAGPSL